MHHAFLYNFLENYFYNFLCVSYLSILTLLKFVFEFEKELH